MNCWEFFHCGRELGGKKEQRLGACPAAVETRLHGVNGGVNGGRACWALEASGRECRKGGMRQKIKSCLRCPFFQHVMQQEGRHLLSMSEIHGRMQVSGDGAPSSTTRSKED